HGGGQIERWLVDRESRYSISRFESDYIPIERQLPPADFSLIEPPIETAPFDAAAEFEYHSPLDYLPFETEEVDGREAAAAHEDDADKPEPGGETSGLAADAEESHAAGGLRFQLDVLRAMDLLRVRSEIKAVVERAFPDKCSAAVVPDIEAALQLSIENPSITYVTYEGEQVINGRHIVTGAKAGQKNTSLLGLKREIKELRVRTEQLAVEDEA